jgi:DNA-binding MarR family transcriptional regulator
MTKRATDRATPAPQGVPWGALAAFRNRIRTFLFLSERAARGVGLEPQQHQLLLVVRAAREEGDPTIAQLAGELLLKHHSVVGLVDRLEGKGFVRRHPHARDRRQVCVRITPLGESLLDRLTGALLEEYRTMGPELVRALQAVLGAPSRDGAGPARARRPARRAPAPKRKAHRKTRKTG